jgi:hypothetical protein
MGTSMSDQQALPIAGIFYWILHYVAGFPLPLIDRRYPFFLESTNFTASLVFVAVNNAILALLIWYIIKMLKKLWN